MGGSWKGYNPENYSPEEYWAQDYWPDAQDGVPTGIGLAIVAINASGKGKFKEEGGGIWWWALPKDLQQMFGFIEADPPAPKVVSVPSRVEGYARAIVPLPWGKGYAETAPSPPPPEPKLETIWARAKGWVSGIWARATGTARPVPMGEAIGHLHPVQAAGSGQFGPTARAGAQFGAITGRADAVYQVTTDEEFLELVGNVLLKMDAPDVSEQEMEELLAMAELANVYFNQAEV